MATAGLRPRLGIKNEMSESRRGEGEEGIVQRGNKQAEREKVNVEERLRTVKTGSDETDVKEAKKSRRVKL